MKITIEIDDKIVNETNINNTNKVEETNKSHNFPSLESGFYLTEDERYNSNVIRNYSDMYFLSSLYKPISYTSPVLGMKVEVIKSKEYAKGTILYRNPRVCKFLYLEKNLGDLNC